MLLFITRLYTCFTEIPITLTFVEIEIDLYLKCTVKWTIINNLVNQYLRIILYFYNQHVHF